jgi:hypothetical protein
MPSLIGHSVYKWYTSTLDFNFLNKSCNFLPQSNVPLNDADGWCGVVELKKFDVSWTSETGHDITVL